MALVKSRNHSDWKKCLGPSSPTVDPLLPNPPVSQHVPKHHIHVSLMPPGTLTPTTSPDSLSQCFTTLSVKTFFLTSNLNFPLHNSRPPPLIIPLVARQKRWTPPHQASFEVIAEGNEVFLTSPDYTIPVPPASPHQICPLGPLLPSHGHAPAPQPPCHVGSSTAHSPRGALTRLPPRSTRPGSAGRPRWAAGRGVVRWWDS